MSHLIQITPNGDINTLDWDSTIAPVDQICTALTTPHAPVEYVHFIGHSRGEDLNICRDDLGLDNNDQLNMAASAYTGVITVGNLVVLGRDPETGEEIGLDPGRAAAERDNIRAAAAIAIRNLRSITR